MILSKNGQKVLCVAQSGNFKVLWQVSGLEIMVKLSIMQGRLKLTPKGVVHIFDYETKKWLGKMVKRDNLFVVETIPADEELYFKDFYTEVK